MRASKIVSAMLLLLFALFAAFGCAESGQQEQDGSAFPFDDGQTVGLGYGYNEMSYPFSEAKNYVQLYAGQTEDSEAQFTYSVDGALTVRMSDTMQSYGNVCFRVYSSAFEEYDEGTEVVVSMLVNVDPQASPNMFLAYNDEDGAEISNKTKVPKAGTFAELSFTTAIETSAGYYRNNMNCGNQKNIMFMFLRLGAGEEFSVDSIGFSFKE